MGEHKFEDALQKLEAIVEEMESGKLTLEESMKKYEEGMKLSRLCTKKLKEAQKKIEILVRDKEGELKAEPFEITEEQNETNEIKSSPANKPKTSTESDSGEDEDLLF